MPPHRDSLDGPVIAAARRAIPPSGTHDYQITPDALSASTIELGPGASLRDFTRAVQPDTVAAAQIVGQFTRLG